MSYDSQDPCSSVQQQLAAYALGEADASVDLLEHLRRCPACRQDLCAYVHAGHQAADQIQTDIPERLRAQVLAAVARPAARATRSRWRWLAAPGPLRMAGALLVCILLLGWNMMLQTQLRGQQERAERGRAFWQTMIALLNDPSVRWYRVSGEQASGHVWAVPEGQIGCLVAQHLPALPNEQVYQAWLIEGAERTSAGVFVPQNGDGWLMLRPDEPLANYSTINVTIEPRDGSAAPSGPLVLQGTLDEGLTPPVSERMDALYTAELHR